MKDLIDHFKEVPGAISVTEAVALHQVIKNNIIPYFEYGVDLGAHAGKSSCIAANALSGICSHFYMVDPLYDMDNPAVWRDTQGTSPKNYYFGRGNYNEIVITNVKKFSHDIEISLEGIPSTEFLSKCPMLGYVFVDTDNHNENLASREADLIKPKLIKGGLLVFHDYMNQFSGISYVFDRLNDGKNFEQIKVDWEEIYKMVDELGGEEGNDSWHIYEGIKPNFIGFLRRI